MQAAPNGKPVSLVVINDENSKSVGAILWRQWNAYPREPHGNSTSDQYLFSATITSQKFAKVTGFTRYPATFRL